MAKRSILREDFRGSGRTLVSSGLDSNNSSRSNVNTIASSSYYSNSIPDVHDSDKMDDDDDDDDDDDEDTDRGRGTDKSGIDDDDDDDDGREKEEELETDKGVWEKKWHYLLLGFGAVFGVRNILDFPALALEHGGGAFLFTYVMLTYTVGLPIVYLEVSLGQYSRGGVVKAWRILPLARGIGVSSLLLSIVRASYSSTPATWSLYYLYSAVSSSLPQHDYYDYTSGGYYDTGVTESSALVNETFGETARNLSAFFHRSAYNACHNYFYTSTLELSDSISSMGQVVTHVIICLVLVWSIVFLMAAIGPRLLGKISLFFTAIPSVLLAMTFIVASTMTGSVLGIQTFLNPRWHRLGTFKPWIDGLDLVLSSLTCGTGLLVSLSGQCNFHGNTFRNAFSMTSLSVAMTTVCGCLMFSLLGAEADLAGVHMDNMSRFTDVDMGFVLFPAVTANLPAPSLWSGMFYLSIILFSLVHAAVVIHHIFQGVLDLASLEVVQQKWRVASLGAVLFIIMAVNIFTTAQNGLYVLRLLQLSVPRLTTPLLCAAQCVAVGWGFGARRFAGRITEMTGKNKSFVWKWLWRWGCPLLLAVIAIASLLTTDLLHDLPSPDMEKIWLQAIGWAINPVILFPGIAMATASFFSVPGTLKQRLKQLRSTPSTWGPGHPEHEPQADLPDYVICHPDPFRPANALAMLTANLYLPNIVSFVNNVQQSSDPDSEMGQNLSCDAGTVSSSEDESSIDTPLSRESFLGRCHATIRCLSHVIGLGNVVRFPYLAYRHGGGAFLLAYLVLMVTCGLPLVIIETAIGQFSSLGPISVWRAVPLFKGVGYSMIVISLVMSIYYSVVTSWSVFYLATSLTSVMPWRDCEQSWNTNSCRVHDLTLDHCHPINLTSSDNMTSPCTDPNVINCGHENVTAIPTCGDISRSLRAALGNESGNPSDEYFYLAVVKISGSWEEVGELRWQLALCLLLTWAMVILFLVKGCKLGGKITYVIILLTFSILLVLLIRSSSLVGGHDGLSHLFTPQWSRLLEGHVWRDAASQVFFSLSLGSGTLIAMGTYNKFTNNLVREAVLLCVFDGTLSLLSSLVTFAVIGALSKATGRAIEVVARADLGLAFVTISDATLHLPWPLFWAILAFLMLVLCGVFTCVAAMATVVTSLMDLFSSALKKQRVWLVLALCAGAAVLGLPMVVQVGFYVVDILDTYLSGLPQVCVGGVVVVAFACVYGVGRLCNDMQRMTGQYVGWCWRLLWLVVCPCCTAMLAVSSMVSLISRPDDLNHPKWATALGLTLWLLLITPILVGMVHEISQYRKDGILEKLRKSCKSKKEWGATLHRYTNHVEYYPTVNTHHGLEGLSTVTDHVEFSTVGVGVPSLSQTTLLPVSPGMPRNKRPLDMRHKAILNHAYSNPQCHTSSGSLEKMGKRKRNCVSLSSENLKDVIIVKKTNKDVRTKDASTQTDHSWTELRLCRQRSQPTVRVTKPVMLRTRSSSWHQLAGQPAILKVNTRQLSNRKKKPPQPQPQPKPSQIDEPRRRRYGQSIAPNLSMLIGQDECHISEEPSTAQHGGACDVIDSSASIVQSPDSLYQSQNSLLNELQQKTSTATFDSDRIPITAFQHGSTSVEAVDETRGITYRTSQRNIQPHMARSQSAVETFKKHKFKDAMCGTRSARSKSVEETTTTYKKKTSTRAAPQGIDNLSFSGRVRSASDTTGIMKHIASSRPSHSFSGQERRARRGHSWDNSQVRVQRHIIMEEEDGECTSQDAMNDFNAQFEIIHSHSEMSKL